MFERGQVEHQTTGQLCRVAVGAAHAARDRATRTARLLDRVTDARPRRPDAALAHGRRRLRPSREATPGTEPASSVSCAVTGAIVSGQGAQTQHEHHQPGRTGHLQRTVAQQQLLGSLAVAPLNERRRSAPGRRRTGRIVSGRHGKPSTVGSENAQTQ